MVNPLEFFSEEEYWQARHEEEVGYVGDPRRCPRHPNVVTSSPDGMHDAPCGACEAEMEYDSLRDTDGRIDPLDSMRREGGFGLL